MSNLFGIPGAPSAITQQFTAVNSLTYWLSPIYSVIDQMFSGFDFEIPDKMIETDGDT